MEKKICSKCGVEKEVCEFYRHSKKKMEVRSQCKVCMNIHSQTYKKLNKEKVEKKNKEYFKLNRELNKVKCAEYKKKNPHYFKNWVNENKEHRTKYMRTYNKSSHVKFKNSLRSRVNELMNKKYKNPKTLNFIGCDYEFLINYIENKFTEGMTWDNYGYYGWHIDHIIPLSSASSDEELKNLFHYTNLQPLWAHENLTKNNKIIV